MLRHTGRVPHLDHRRFVKAQSKERKSTQGTSHKTKNHCKRDRWEKSKAQLSLLKKTKKINEIYIRCTWCTKRNRIGTIFCKCGIKLGGLYQIYTKRMPKMTIGRGSQVFRPSYSFVSSNKPDEEIDMGNLQSKSTGHWCEIIIEDVFEKESLIQKTQNEDLLRRLRRALGKDETYRQQVSWHGHTKAEVERWDTKMGE